MISVKRKIEHFNGIPCVFLQNKEWCEEAGGWWVVYQVFSLENGNDITRIFNQRVVRRAWFR